MDQKGTEICNFDVCVDSIRNSYAVANEEMITCVLLRMNFGEDNYSKVISVPVEEIEDIHWSELDNRCWFNPEVSTAKIKRYLENSVRKSMRNIPAKKVYQFSQPGMAMIEGKTVFCTGIEVIKPPITEEKDLMIELQPMNHCLDIDLEISESQIISDMYDFISLSPNPGRIILAHKLIYLMRQAYVDAGVSPKVCVYLYGPSGTQKTTYSSLLVQMYNRKEGIKNPVRLNASIAAATQILLESSNDTVVLDDLYPADSKQIRKQQEETLLEVTRFVGDGIIPARRKGATAQKASVQCGVVFTGEYVIGSGSDAARILPVEMMKPDGEKLKYFQDNPLIISTFYYYFIKWFIAHYKEIVLLLKEWLQQYRKINLGVHDRLQEAHFLFNTAYCLFLQYCGEKQFLTKQDAFRLHKSFIQLLTMLVIQQNQRAKQGAYVKVQSKNYLNCIKVLYKSKQLSIANNVKEFNAEIHEGLVHRNSLYLRGDKVSAYFPEASISEIVDSLASQGALDEGNKTRTKQISALKGMRFYVIPLKYLD